ncbi:MAG TPA: RimK family alpha-L-glutamate ligase [Isosphaeraceae bacterium]|jgi:ribosomal protein S6--L-glutamate ligase|nr:RimK family alpha-L-glutamate ligase [Isosphaeraceae bacterium]
MTRIVALVAGLGWHVQDLERAAARLGIAFEPAPFATVTGRVGHGAARVTAGGVDLAEVDAVLVRMMPPGSLEQVVFRMDALHRLKADGIPVVNPPAAIEAAVDKYLALARLDAARIPVPATWAGESAAGAVEAFDVLGGDVVVKPLFGSEGRGLVRVTDREVMGRVAHALERIGAILYVQKYIQNDGTDLRVFLLGGRVLGAIRRHAPPGDWRTNVAVGGRAEACRVDAATERLASRATKAVGAEIAGVDILDGEGGGPVVLEVNAVPGWRALAAATGVDVAAEVLEFVRRQRG